MNTYNGRKAVSSIAVCITGRDLIAFAGAANVLNLWDPRQRQAEGEASPHTTLHPCQLWDWMLMLPKKSQGVRTFASHASHIHALAWQPDSEHHVVTAGMDKTLKLWDLRAAVPLHTLEGHTAQVNGFASLLDIAGFLQRAFWLTLGSAQVLCATWWEGSKIVSGSADKTVRVYGTDL